MQHTKLKIMITRFETFAAKGAAMEDALRQKRKEQLKIRFNLVVHLF
jgi:hypothetical protein